MSGDRFENHFGSFDGDTVFKTERGYALRFQVGVTGCVLFLPGSGVVRFTIEFHSELCFVAVEIEEVVTKLVLPTEFQFAALTVAEQFPQQFLSGSLFLPQFTCAFFQSGEVETAAIMTAPFSRWEKGRG